MKRILAIALLVGLAACNNGPDKVVTPPHPDAPKMLTYSVINTYPHDTSSFTEGLLFYKDKMYESTGFEARSKVAEIDIKTGKPVRSVALDPKYFGEGMIIVNDTVYQWTYKNKVGLMYSLKDFKKIGEFQYASPEGWGMTTDGKNIIASDGTSDLYFYEPGTFRLINKLGVTESGSYVGGLNELEYIDGFIYANQWLTPYILKIDPGTGKVVGKIDFTMLKDGLKARHPYINEFNGIAYDPTNKKIYVTGKNWPELYEVQLGQ